MLIRYGPEMAPDPAAPFSADHDDLLRLI